MRGKYEGGASAVGEKGHVNLYVGEQAGILWKHSSLAGDRNIDWRKIRYPSYAGKCEKFYAVDKPLEGWCALQNTLSGETIGLSYPVDKLPYLGVWEGIINGKYVTALEPVTGALDRLDVAKVAGKAGVIKARSKYEWFLNLTFETVNEINDIDQDGYINESMIQEDRVLIA